MTSLTNEIQEKYPFLSLVTYGGLEYIGIIQNSDEVVLSMYNFDLIKSEDDKIEYLKLGENWWWESNQKIPINLFLKKDWSKFYFTLTTLNVKDCEVKFGPQVCMSDLSKTRSKRKNIQLVKRVK
jgi:hypothetical protein|tara:strand:- start:192 stop:566 length:375 start_codon:yes stop_codon:yes gene_type:complete